MRKVEAMVTPSGTFAELEWAEVVNGKMVTRTAKRGEIVSVAAATHTAYPKIFVRHGDE